MKARKPHEAPGEAAEETAGEGNEPASRGPAVVLSVIAAVGAWRTIVAFPEVAYVVVGSIGTVGVQKARAWRVRRTDGDEDLAVEDAAQPDVVGALRRLVGDDKGVLLTVLQKDLGLPDTKAVKALLEAEGIPWKASRTRDGNGPAVRKEAIPPAPSPSPADAHSDGCCCRSADNGNSNNGEAEQSQEGIRVERTDGGLVIYDLADAHRHHGLTRQ
ncbi:hypothetical protein [Streptomyces sp. NPDC096132]|uniref:hypothetical protein n=1 Tax=Streptomyces sp. NPDC096132 TaxID=3366075 RepID=UPI003807C161